MKCWTHCEHGTGQMNEEHGNCTLKSILSPVVPWSDCHKQTKNKNKTTTTHTYTE